MSIARVAFIVKASFLFSGIALAKQPGEMLNSRVYSKVKPQARTDLRIGELALASGVPATALRYYEKAGLVRKPRRTTAGYRAYDADTVSRLAFIRAAQAVGLSLSEIKEVIAIRDRGAAPCQHVVELLERRRHEVRSRIRELQLLERDLARVATRGAALDAADCDASGICKVIPTLERSAVSATDASRRRTPRPRAGP